MQMNFLNVTHEYIKRMLKRMWIRKYNVCETYQADQREHI